MVVSLFHLHVFFHCVWATLLWLNCPFASFTKWLWWALHKCVHVNEQSEDKAGSAREKAIQTGDALTWDSDTGFFSCIISQGPPSHCVDQVATATALGLNKETRSLDIPLLDNISTVKCRQRVRQQVQTLGCITPIHNCKSVIQTDPFFKTAHYAANHRSGLPNQLIQPDRVTCSDSGLPSDHGKGEICHLSHIWEFHLF